MRSPKAMTLLLASIFPLALFAQWECPSQLAGALKPIGNSKIYWASEVTSGAGYLTNHAIFNSMGIVGLDLTALKSTFYAEGGFKYWNIYDFDNKRPLDNFHFGLRELFWQKQGKAGKLALGIQSASLDDDYLLNERLIGVTYRSNIGPLTLSFAGGAVTKDFARNGVFCAVGFLYDIIPDRNIALLGNTLGQTNLTGFSLSLNPSKIKSKTKSGGEFEAVDEFSQGLTESTDGQNKLSAIGVESVGVVLYDEFGTWVPENVLLGGGFAEFRLPAGVFFKPLILYQHSDDNKAVLYSLAIDKSFTGAFGRATLNLRYLGKSNLDPDAHALNSFSNIFSGNVIRLDTPDMPFLMAGIKYSIPKFKTHLKIQFASQTTNDPMREFDLQIGKKFKELLQLNAIAGYVRSPALAKAAILGRIELRLYF